jgi:hypothetical protein
MRTALSREICDRLCKWFLKCELINLIFRETII